MGVVWRRIYGRDGSTVTQGTIKGEEEREVEYFGDSERRVAKPNYKDGGVRFAGADGSGVDIDDRDLSYHGDAIKTRAVERDYESGKVRQIFARFDSSTGEYKGEYEAEWEVTDRGQLTHASTKRYFS